MEHDYLRLLKDILDNGIQKEDRTGTGTISIFGRQIRHKMSVGFPLLTTKKMPFKTIVTELLWFLRGDTNIKYLHDNNCHIWDGDYIKSGRTDGELGPIYGKQWRKVVEMGWHKEGETGIRYIDQIANLISDIKTNPDSRRLMVSAWNVGELDQMTLPPCHYGFQVYTRELNLTDRIQYKKKRDGISRTFAPYTDQMLDDSNIPTRAISLMWNQRSVDTFLGLPFNIASYGLLLEILAREVNMVPDELIGNLGDTHLYLNHIEQAKEQIGRQMTWEEKIQWVIKNTDIEMDNVLITEESYKKTTPTHTREPYQLPTLDIHPEILDYDLDKLEIGMFTIKNYQSHPPIKAQLSN